MNNFIYNILIKIVNLFERNQKVDDSKNFPVKIKGKEYWISRSCAVAGFVYIQDNGKWYVLAEKRGKGCPDWNGYWCCPCGYIDRDEDGRQAIVREIFEETGLILFSNDFKLCGINFGLDTNRQNITLRYRQVLLGSDKSKMESLFSTKNMEKDEVDDIKFIPLSDIHKYQWAFGHEKRILEMFDNTIHIKED